MSGLSWLLYMALEPYVRKLWPQTIISWTRLVSGRIRDPLVGRDVMFGVMLGLIWVVIIEIRFVFGIARFGIAPQMLSTDYLLANHAWRMDRTAARRNTGYAVLLHHFGRAALFAPKSLGCRRRFRCCLHYS